MSMDESFRSSDLGDEEEKEDEGGVHGDRPAMNTTESERVVGSSKWMKKRTGPLVRLMKSQ